MQREVCRVCSTMKKGKRAAVSRMWSHQLGHELALEVSRQLVSSQVCRTENEILKCEQFRLARLEAEGSKK